MPYLIAVGQTVRAYARRTTSNTGFFASRPSRSLNSSEVTSRLDRVPMTSY